MASSGPAYERLGAKILSLPDVIAQSVGFMGPVFSSAFVIPLVVGVISASGKGGGIASPLSVLIAAVGVFALGWIVSSYVKEIHAAGSLYDYVTRGLGERVGTAAGWLYYGGVTVLLTGLLLLIGGYLQSTIASEFKVNPLPACLDADRDRADRGDPVLRGAPVHPQPAGAGAGLDDRRADLLHHRDRQARLGEQPQAVQPVVRLGRLVRDLLRRAVRRAAVRRVRDRGEPGRGDAQPAPGDPDRGHDHGRDRHRLLRPGHLRRGGRLPLQPEDPDRGGVGTAVRAGRASAGGYGGTWIDRLLELVVLFDMLAVAIGCAVSASRGIFAMARDRRIPAQLAIVSRRHSSPLGATVFIIGAAIVTLLVDLFWTGLFALPATPHYFALFAWGSTFGGFALVVVYLLMSVGSLRTFATSERRVSLTVSAVVGILITAGAIFGSFYKVTSPTILAPWLALALLVVGFASTWVLRARRSASTELTDLSAETTV